MSQIDTESSSLESGEATVASTSNCTHTDATVDAADEFAIGASVHVDVERGAR